VLHLGTHPIVVNCIHVVFIVLSKLAGARGVSYKIVARSAAHRSHWRSRCLRSS
jgi:hypothetical protein